VAVNVGWRGMHLHVNTDSDWGLALFMRPSDCFIPTPLWLCNVTRVVRGPCFDCTLTESCLTCCYLPFGIFARMDVQLCRVSMYIIANISLYDSKFDISVLLLHRHTVICLCRYSYRIIVLHVLSLDCFDFFAQKRVFLLCFL